MKKVNVIRYNTEVIELYIQEVNFTVTALLFFLNIIQRHNSGTEDVLFTTYIRDADGRGCKLQLVWLAEDLTVNQ